MNITVKISYSILLTVKKLNEKRLKRLNGSLEHHMAGAHVLPHKVSTYIYIYIYIDWLIDELCLLFGALRIIGATTN